MPLPLYRARISLSVEAYGNGLIFRSPSGVCFFARSSGESGRLSSSPKLRLGFYYIVFRNVVSEVCPKYKLDVPPEGHFQTKPEVNKPSLLILLLTRLVVWKFLWNKKLYYKRSLKSKKFCLKSGDLSKSFPQGKQAKLVNLALSG